MTNLFKIGEIVHFQISPNSGTHVRARIIYAGTKYYSIQRLDAFADGQTHQVQERHLSHPPHVNIPKGESHHAAL
jgi:hypothetical protein